MRIHAMRSGTVRIKRSQVRGRGRGLGRRLRIFADLKWTDWLPTYAWMIEHPEGLIVIDTGQGVKRGVLTHLNIDHDGGLAIFPRATSCLSTGTAHRTRVGQPIRGYLQPIAILVQSEPARSYARAFGRFAGSTHLTAAGDVIAVATPGNTASHLSVIVLDDGIA
jgi:N-acyl homoserine lactone hydrolase